MTTTHQNFRVEPATCDSLEALLEMMDDFNAHEAIPMGREELRGPLAHLLVSPELGRVYMFVSDTIVGYSVTTFGFDLEFGGRDAFITELYLKPASRGVGLGSRALAAVLEATKNAGASAVHLQVRSENAAARKVYLRAGFEEPDRVLMTKRL